MQLTPVCLVVQNRLVPTGEFHIPFCAFPRVNKAFIRNRAVLVTTLFPRRRSEEENNWVLCRNRNPRLSIATKTIVQVFLAIVALPDGKQRLIFSLQTNVINQIQLAWFSYAFFLDSSNTCLPNGVISQKP